MLRFVVLTFESGTCLLKVRKTEIKFFSIHVEFKILKPLTTRPQIITSEKRNMTFSEISPAHFKPVREYREMSK